MILCFYCHITPGLWTAMRLTLSRLRRLCQRCRSGMDKSFHQKWQPWQRKKDCIKPQGHPTWKQNESSTEEQFCLGVLFLFLTVYWWHWRIVTWCAWNRRHNMTNMGSSPHFPRGDFAELVDQGRKAPLDPLGPSYPRGLVGCLILVPWRQQGKPWWWAAQWGEGEFGMEVGKSVEFGFVKFFSNFSHIFHNITLRIPCSKPQEKKKSTSKASSRAPRCWSRSGRNRPWPTSTCPQRVWCLLLFGISKNDSVGGVVVKHSFIGRSSLVLGSDVVMSLGVDKGGWLLVTEDTDAKLMGIVDEEKERLAA